MSTLSKEIKQLLEHHLPKMQLDIFREYIDNIEQKNGSLEEENKNLKYNLNVNREKSIELSGELATYKKKESEINNLLSEAKEKFEEAKGKELEVALATLKVKEAEKRADLAKDLVSLAFRNPVLKYTENGRTQTITEQG